MDNTIFKKVDQKYLIYNNQLGKGTYGVVMKASKIEDKQILACKVIAKKQIQAKIQQSDSPDKAKLKNYIIARLKDQIKIWKQIEHPNIVNFVNYSQTPNNIYLFMEFCNGGNLKQVINQNGALPQKKALPIIRDIINATAYLYEKGVIHRDIKPQNVLLNDGVAKLADFGLAKFRQKVDIQLTSTPIGTILYMAPQLLEQVPRYSAKCDIWSIGILIYVLVFGYFPYETTVKHIMQYKMNLQKKLVFQPNCDISKQLMNIIERSLKYAQQDRCDIKEMQKLLYQLLQGKMQLE